MYAQLKDDTNVAQYSCAACTAGAAIVTVLRWLVEVRCVGRLRLLAPAFTPPLLCGWDARCRGVWGGVVGGGAALPLPKPKP